MEWGISWELIESREYWVYKWLVDKLVVDKFNGLMFVGYEEVIFRNIFDKKNDLMENLKINIKNKWNMTYIVTLEIYFHWSETLDCGELIIDMNCLKIFV